METIEAYLEKLAAFADDEYGRQVRGQFEDVRGDSELAMLQTPSADELEQLFTSHNDAMDAVLHNKVIDLITELCGEEVKIETPITKEFGGEQESVRVLKCRDKLAKSLAHTVIRHSRLQ